MSVAAMFLPEETPFSQMTTIMIKALKNDKNLNKQYFKIKGLQIGTPYTCIFT